MKIKVDNIELDRNNVEFNYAADFIKHTDKLLYLTGKAGTGKTTFLKYIKNETSKKCVVVAPTGVAAINAGGVTIHSFFQIPFGPFVPNDLRLRTSASDTESKDTIYTIFKYDESKKEILKNLELLIIDEISMVRADLLDVIDRILRVFRNKPSLPFGGVQVILIGDTFQLPPIVDNKQRSILNQFYESPFFFSSWVLKQNPPTYIELKKIYRQNEKEFIDLLNRVRVNKLGHSDFQLLNSKYNPSFSGNGNDYIVLATHNNIVNETNLKKLNQLESELFTYEAAATGVFPDKHKPTDHFLKLKIGAQIMFVKNDPGEDKRYYNGKIGKIKELNEKEIKVVFDDGSEVDVETTTWENIQYSYNRQTKQVEEEIIGTFEQFAIRLAWAITVHKSQGLTFEKVIADLSNAFAAGQVYVALSRCTSFHGLKLRSKLNHNAVKTDPNVLKFAANVTPETVITEQLNTGKADFYYKKSREAFLKGNFETCLSNFTQATKYRNDIETDYFNRFIKVHGKKLWNYGAKLKKLSLKQVDLADRLDDSIIEVKGLEDTLNEKDKIVLEKNKSIELLTEELQGFKDFYLCSENENERLKTKLSTSKNRIQLLESKLKKTNDNLMYHKGLNDAKSREIKRLKSLSWYDHLLKRKLQT